MSLTGKVLFYNRIFLSFIKTSNFGLSNLNYLLFDRTNPLGMKGHIAKRYGDLIQEIWSGSAKTIAPLKLRVSSLLYVCFTRAFL